MRLSSLNIKVLGLINWRVGKIVIVIDSIKRKRQKLKVTAVSFYVEFCLLVLCQEFLYFESSLTTATCSYDGLAVAWVGYVTCGKYTGYVGGR